MKYIIEIPDDVQYVLFNGQTDNKCYTAVRPVAELEVLNSDYINEHFGELQDQAYQKGLEVAWECARKIAKYWTEIDNDDLLSMFGIDERIGHSTIRALFEKQTASEAIAKMRAHKQRKKEEDEIKVGDEVIYSEDRYIVTYIYGKECDGIDNITGIVCEQMKIQELKKTGRTFPQLKEFLKEMQK